MKKMILMLVAIMIAACGIEAINIEQFVHPLDVK